MSTVPPVITRFAPSPTGHLHIGGARTALFAWAYARRHGGRFILRIEDTDQARSSEAATRRILDDLAWLGLAWDDGPALQVGGRTIGGDDRGVGPYHQSQRLDTYGTYVERLLASGGAYHAFETPEELEARRKEAIGAKRQYRYDRAALEIPSAERARRAAAGEAHVVRFRMPDEPVTVVDEVLGDVTIAPGEIDDFVVRKADGFPTYHFAVVVDDELMGVTHVIRGQEHLINTPRHVALQRALGFRTPAYAHLPLIFNTDGSKMSKRDKDKAARQAVQSAGLNESPVAEVSNDEFHAWLGDKHRQLATDQLIHLADRLKVDLPEIDVEDFARSGYLPETVCNYLALLGWSPGGDVEKFDNAFLAEHFDLKRIGKTNAKFDRKKLLAFNTDALAAMSDEDFERRWRAWCEKHEHAVTQTLSDRQFGILAAAIRPRCKTFHDAAQQAEFALLGDGGIHYDQKAADKFLLKNDGEGLTALRQVRERLDALEAFDGPSVQAAVERMAEETGLGMGKIAQPLRIALTGGPVSPPIDATLAVLGRETALRRIDRCIEAMSARV